MKKYFGLLISAIVLLSSCVPKEVAETTEETKVIHEESTVETVENPCATFSSVPNGSEMEDNYIIYRDYVKQKNWEEAFSLWEKVFKETPAADGRRQTVFNDGVKIYEHFLNQEPDTLKKLDIINNIFSVYDKSQECYPNGGYADARKAFGVYYKYPFYMSEMENYELFKKSIEKDTVPRYFIINPFTALMINLYVKEKVTMEEAQHYASLIKKTIREAKRETATDKMKWETIEKYALVRLEEFEGVKGFYDCEYYSDKYYPEYESNSSDCEVIRSTYARLNWGGCLKDDPRMQELSQKIATSCTVVTTPGPIRTAWDCYKNGDYKCAIENFETAAEQTDDDLKKSKYYFRISKIYYGNLKRFGQARKYALKAAKYRKNWGEPYMLIGRLYASSGPLCGPGTGWDSQIVTWPAIDKWQYAKKIDPSVAAEANRSIAKYSQYMPSKSDIFSRGLSEGQSFSIGCWIQETTRIRAAKK